MTDKPMLPFMLGQYQNGTWFLFDETCGEVIGTCPEDNMEVLKDMMVNYNRDYKRDIEKQEQIEKQQQEKIDD